MSFLAPAVPWIIQGGSMLAGHIFGNKAQKNAMQRSPEEMQALTGAQGAAGQLGKSGAGFLTQAAPWVGQAGNYYQTLLRGNRAAMSQAVAGPTAQLTDVYRGAGRNLERAGLTGAARDVAQADLNRDRASKIAGLTTGMQPAAAGALGQLGLGTGTLGGQLAQAGGNIYEKLLGQGAHNREYARGEGEKTARGITEFGTDIANMFGGGKKAGTPRDPGYMRPGPLPTWDPNQMPTSSGPLQWPTPPPSYF